MYIRTTWLHHIIIIKITKKMSWVNAVSKPAQRRKANATTLHHTATSHIHEVFGLPCSASLLLQQKVGMPYSKAAMDPVSKSKVLATKQIGLHHAKFIVPTRTVVWGFHPQKCSQHIEGLARNNIGFRGAIAAFMATPVGFGAAVWLMPKSLRTWGWKHGTFRRFKVCPCKMSFTKD